MIYKIQTTISTGLVLGKNIKTILMKKRVIKQINRNPPQTVKSSFVVQA